MERTPYCRIYYRDHQPYYVVYDQFGRVFTHTTSSAVARQFLALADQGISAQLYALLERWNWQIPKWITDQIKAPLQGIDKLRK